VLEAALEGAADYIVSGDLHLLDLGSFRGIPILRPADFVATVLSGDTGEP
jgi:predicted nucleic acid-binding protein